jgi:uncharacterized protein YndB with AHSA1/START domain
MGSSSIVSAQDSVTVEKFIAAPPERVFQAITEPVQLLQWWGHAGAYRTTKWCSDLQAGGTWSSSGVQADGKPFWVRGEYLELDPPHLLVHTWQPSWQAELKTTVRWELIAQDNGMLVKIQHSGFAGNAKAAQDHSTGWQRVMGWMQGFVERGSTIDCPK